MTGSSHGHTPSHGAKSGLFARKWTFLAVAFIVFGASVMALNGLDLLPNGTLGEEAPLGTKPTDSQQGLTESGVLPEKIEIPKLKLTATVANPTTTNADVLDQNLLYGAVRYPTSGSLGQQGGNVVIFGHSSYLPVVRNPAYKIFDGIQNLSKGDKILVTGNHTTYVYEVEMVAGANTANASVPLQVEGNKLTLVTCDSFKTKSDRFVVMAHLVESYPSSN